MIFVNVLSHPALVNVHPAYVQQHLVTDSRNHTELFCIDLLVPYNEPVCAGCLPRSYLVNITAAMSLVITKVRAMVLGTPMAMRNVRQCMQEEVNHL